MPSMKEFHIQEDCHYQQCSDCKCGHWHTKERRLNTRNIVTSLTLDARNPIRWSPVGYLFDVFVTVDEEGVEGGEPEFVMRRDGDADRPSVSHLCVHCYRGTSLPGSALCSSLKKARNTRGP